MSLINNLHINPRELLAALDINVSNEDKAETVKALVSHFDNLITEVTISQLTEQQAEDYQDALKLPSPQKEEKISYITSQVPGLLKTIDEAIEQELKIIHDSYRR